MNDKLHRVIGIDLGTTYCAVAAFDSYYEQAEIIKNKKEGDIITTPSVVSLHTQLRKAMVGQIAKNNLPLDPQNTIIEIKREMGEEFRKETLEKFNAKESFQVGKPVKVHFAGQWFSPQEISALILMKMKEIAEQEIGGSICDAVITVPAYFTEKQRKATKEAALLAGLYPRQLIPEPTAAAICYGVDKLEEEKKIYLVYDLGGGTFDVSIIVVEESNIQVVATSGDPRLGGGDFDDAITEWAVKELKEKYNIDCSGDDQAKIKFKAEQVKILLSSNNETTLSVADMFPQQAPVLNLTRKMFEELIERITEKSITYVDIALNSAKNKGVGRQDVDAILLVGGSSKIPRIKERLLDYFGKDDSFVRSDLNPDEVVARGAAIMAYRYKPSSGEFDVNKEIDINLVNTEADDDLNVQLIAEHSLGIGVQGGEMTYIISQGTNIPVEVPRGGYTNPNMAPNVQVPIYQGEGEVTFENTLIGTMTIGPMEPKPAGFHQFEVVFKLDENGLLSVLVKHLNENKEYEAQFDHKTGVSGDMSIVRNKLVNLYADQAAISTVNGRSSEPAIPPPPPPPHTPYQSPVDPKQSQPESVSPPLPPPTSAESSAIQDPSPIETPIATEVSIPEPPPIGVPSGATQSTEIEIPAEFKSIVRRAKKKIKKTNNPALSGALNAFMVALEGGVAGEKLEDLGDDLADVYHDTPDRPAILEPKVEVPAQFRSIVRRVNKQLIIDLSPDLLEAFNAFITSLNSGFSEEDLEDLGDTLADTYHDVRR